MDKKLLKRPKTSIHLQSRSSRIIRGNVAPTHDRKGNKSSKRTLIFRKRDVGTNNKELEVGFIRSWHEAMIGDTRPLSDLWDELDAE